jgi:hypothetical protein
MKAGTIFKWISRANISDGAASSGACTFWSHELPLGGSATNVRLGSWPPLQTSLAEWQRRVVSVAPESGMRKLKPREPTGTHPIGLRNPDQLTSDRALPPAPGKRVTVAFLTCCALPFETPSRHFYFADGTTFEPGCNIGR